MSELEMQLDQIGALEIIRAVMQQKAPTLEKLESAIHSAVASRKVQEVIPPASYEDAIAMIHRAIDSGAEILYGEEARDVL